MIRLPMRNGPISRSFEAACLHLLNWTHSSTSSCEHYLLISRDENTFCSLCVPFCWCEIVAGWVEFAVACDMNVQLIEIRQSGIIICHKLINHQVFVIYQWWQWTSSTDDRWPRPTLDRRHRTSEKQTYSHTFFGSKSAFDMARW